MTAREVSSERVSEELHLTTYELQVLLGTTIHGCNMAPDRVFSLPMAWHRLHALGLVDRTDGLAIATDKGNAVVNSALRSSVKTEIRIKPLEWERVTEIPVFHGDETKRFWKASNPFGGSFWVNVHTEDFEGESSWGGKKFSTSAAAMNAVEDHLRACVLFAIEAPAAASEVTEDWLRDTAMNVMLATEVEEAIHILTATLKGDRP